MWEGPPCVNSEPRIPALGLFFFGDIQVSLCPPNKDAGDGKRAVIVPICRQQKAAGLELTLRSGKFT